MTCADLIPDADLLGRALLDDTAPTLGRQVSRWTLAQRCSAIRDFVTLMRPELVDLLSEDPHLHLDLSLRAVAERVGAGHRLNGGAPRQRGGRAPSAAQICAVPDAVGQAPGYLGLRNRAFFTILAETGSRVNALRALDGTDCVEMPNGRLRLFRHEKGKGEPREVELSHAEAEGCDRTLGRSTTTAPYADGRRVSASVSKGQSGAARHAAGGRFMTSTGRCGPVA